MTNRIEKKLLEDVVIFKKDGEVRTGAQSLAPDHSPRDAHKTKPVMHAAVGASAELQSLAEQFLYYQAELLDSKNWRDYIDLFADDGTYWMPARPDQVEWTDSASIFAEDRRLMEVRAGRVTHPNAWSQAPHWGTSHLISNVVIEDASSTGIVVRSRFQVTEIRRDDIRHFAGSYRHTLRRNAHELKIVLQRVDLLNAQAPFDYTIQAWV